MKKLLSILLLFISLGAFAQTYDTLPTGSKPYGNQLYLSPTGLIIGGAGSAKFRVIGTKKYVDSLLALKAPVSPSGSYIQASPLSRQAANINITGSSVLDGDVLIGSTFYYPNPDGGDWNSQNTNTKILATSTIGQFNGRVNYVNLLTLPFLKLLSNSTLPTGASTDKLLSIDGSGNVGTNGTTDALQKYIEKKTDSLGALKLNSINTSKDSLNNLFLTGVTPVLPGYSSNIEPQIQTINDTTKVIFFSQSKDRNEYGHADIVMSFSYDNGLTFNPPITILTDSYQKRNISTGIVNGRFVIWFTRTTGTTLQDYGFIYSNNITTSATWSVYQKQTFVGDLKMVPFGNIEKTGDGSYLVAMYNNNTNYLEGWRSINGISWSKQTPAIIDTRTSDPSSLLSECYMRYVGNNRMIMLIRDDNSTPGTFYQITSLNNGYNWSGLTRTNISGQSNNGLSQMSPSLYADTTKNLLLVGYGERYKASGADSKDDKLIIMVNKISTAFSSPSSYLTKFKLRRPTPSTQPFYGYVTFIKNNDDYEFFFNDRVIDNADNSSILTMWKGYVNIKNSNKTLLDANRIDGLSPVFNTITKNFDYLSKFVTDAIAYNPSDSSNVLRNPGRLKLIAPQRDSLGLEIISNTINGNAIPTKLFRFYTKKGNPKFVVGIDDNGIDNLQVKGSGYFSSKVKATGFSIPTGTSSQFLKADGSVDAVEKIPLLGTGFIGDLGLGGPVLTGGLAANWITLNGNSTYSGGFIYSISGVPKGYSYYDGPTNGIVIQGVTGAPISLKPNGTTALKLNIDGTSVFSGTLTGISATFSNRVKASVLATTGYTVSTLPAGTIGDMAYVTDATAPTYNANVVGGGSIKIPVFFNGTNWVSH